MVNKNNNLEAMREYLKSIKGSTVPYELSEELISEKKPFLSSSFGDIDGMSDIYDRKWIFKDGTKTKVVIQKPDLADIKCMKCKKKAILIIEYIQNGPLKNRKPLDSLCQEHSPVDNEGKCAYNKPTIIKVFPLETRVSSGLFYQFDKFREFNSEINPNKCTWCNKKITEKNKHLFIVKEVKNAPEEDQCFLVGPSCPIIEFSYFVCKRPCLKEIN